MEDEILAAVAKVERLSSGGVFQAMRYARRDLGRLVQEALREVHEDGAWSHWARRQQWWCDASRGMDRMLEEARWQEVRQARDEATAARAADRAERQRQADAAREVARRRQAVAAREVLQNRRESGRTTGRNLPLAGVRAGRSDAQLAVQVARLNSAALSDLADH